MRSLCTLISLPYTLVHPYRTAFGTGSYASEGLSLLQSFCLTFMYFPENRSIQVRLRLCKHCTDQALMSSVDILEKLNREIEELKAMRKKETQINRVAQIQSELLKKIKERDSLMGR